MSIAPENLGSRQRMPSFVERGQEAQYGQASADVYASIVKCFDDKVFPSVCRWFETRSSRCL